MQTPEQTMLFINEWLDNPESKTNHAININMMEAYLTATDNERKSLLASSAAVIVFSVAVLESPRLDVLDVKESVKAYEKLAHKEG